MFSDKLISDCSVLNKLDYDDFTKVSLQSIQDHQLLFQSCPSFRKSNENHLQSLIQTQEFIEISQENGQKLTDLTLKLIQALSQFNFNSNLIEQKIKLLRFDKQRADFLKNKITQNLYELRKIIFDKELNDLTEIQKVDWRFQIEVASKSCKNIFNPNILMHLTLKNQCQANPQNVLFNMDFANLKNLQYQLNQALKMHNNPKIKLARNSSV